MEKTNKIKLSIKPYGNQYVVTIPNEILNNKATHRFFSDLTQVKIKNTIDKMSVVTNLLVIDLPIRPSDETKYYFSLSGIEEIIYALFNVLNSNEINEVANTKNIVLYVTLKESKYHTLPIMNIRLVLEGEFSEDFIDKIASRAIAEMPIYIGGTGSVEYFKDISLLYSIENVFPQGQTLELLESLTNEIGKENRLINFLSAGITSINSDNLFVSKSTIEYFDVIRNLEEDDEDDDYEDIKNVLDMSNSDEDYSDLPF